MKGEINNLIVYIRKCFPNRDQRFKFELLKSVILLSLSDRQLEAADSLDYSVEQILKINHIRVEEDEAQIIGYDETSAQTPEILYYVDVLKYYMTHPGEGDIKKFICLMLVYPLCGRLPQIGCQPEEVGDICKKLKEELQLDEAFFIDDEKKLDEYIEEKSLYKRKVQEYLGRTEPNIYTEPESCFEEGYYHLKAILKREKNYEKE